MSLSQTCKGMDKLEKYQQEYFSIEFFRPLIYVLLWAFFFSRNSSLSHLQSFNSDCSRNIFPFGWKDQWQKYAVCSWVWIWKVVVVHGSESQLEVQWSITARLPPSFRKQSYVHVTISDQLQSAENLPACEMIIHHQVQVWHSCPMTRGVLITIQP